MASFALRLPDDLYERIKAHAEAASKSINQVVIEALEDRLRLTQARAALGKMKALQQSMPLSGSSLELPRQLREERGEPRR